MKISSTCGINIYLLEMQKFKTAENVNVGQHVNQPEISHIANENQQWGDCQGDGGIKGLNGNGKKHNKD